MTLQIEQREQSDAAVVTPTGSLEPATYRTLWNALLKAGADAPTAVVVDLRRLTITSSSALTVFGSAAKELARWPGIPVLLVTDDPKQRDLLNRHHVHPTVDAALRGMDEAPRHIARISLPNSNTSVHLGRTFVRETCQQWGMSDARTVDALLVANELVENTICHTYHAASLRLERRRGRFTIAVYDGSPPSRFETGTPGAPRSGLTLVARLARSWGCSPTLPGGKVVWAVL